MFVYLDESGCTGMKLGRGSSAFFTLTAVVFPDQVAAQQARRSIVQLKARLGWDPRREFKFNKADKVCKLAFFEALGGANFEVYSFTLNKAALIPGALADAKKQYRKVASWTLENIFAELAAPSGPYRATFVFDACGERELYEFLQRYVATLASRISNQRAVVRVIAQDSQAEGLLQLADMACGAIAKCESGDENAAACVRAIAAKIRSRRRWP